MSNFAFAKACEKGDIGEAKRLQTLGADIHAQDDIAFAYSCEHGHIEIAKWLYSIRSKSGIDIHADEDWVFRWSCYNGHITVAKWLYSIRSDLGVDIHACNDDAFRYSFRNSSTEITEWLLKIGSFTEELINKMASKSCVGDSLLNNMKLALINHTKKKHEIKRQLQLFLIPDLANLVYLYE